MAGSLTWRQYSSDNGALYAVKIDESNANATVAGGTGALLPVRSANVALAPCGLKKRYANTYNQAQPNQKRRFFIGTAANYLAASNPGALITAEDYSGAANTAGTQQKWVVTSVRGEKLSNPPAITSPDTGLTDGTPAQ